VPFTPEDLKRLAWHSRRGMWEVDIILGSFVEKCLQSAPEADLRLYRDLLAEEDQDLFLWLTRRAVAPTENLQASVELVLRAHGLRG
jgi:antitoxin CptB